MNVPLSFKNNWKQANQKSIFEVWLTKEQIFKVGAIEKPNFFQGIWAYENLLMAVDRAWRHGQ